MRLIDLAQRCLQDYGHPNFTDRHGMADILRGVIAKAVARERAALSSSPSPDVMQDSPNFKPDELKAFEARGYERVNRPSAPSQVSIIDRESRQRRRAFAIVVEERNSLRKEVSALKARNAELEAEIRAATKGWKFTQPLREGDVVLDEHGRPTTPVDPAKE